MSRIRHIIRSFALIALVSCMFFSFGCSVDSVVAPASGPEGVNSESSDVNTAPSGPSLAEAGGING